MIYITDTKRISFQTSCYRSETKDSEGNWLKDNGYYVNPLILLKDIDKRYTEIISRLKDTINNAAVELCASLEEKKVELENKDLVFKLNDTQTIYARKIRGSNSHCYGLKEKDLNGELKNTGEYFHTSLKSIISNILFDNVFKFRDMQIKNLEDIVSEEILTFSNTFFVNRIKNKDNEEERLLLEEEIELEVDEDLTGEFTEGFGEEVLFGEEL